MGSPNSISAVCGPCSHLNNSLSCPSLPELFRTSIDSPAVRQLVRTLWAQLPAPSQVLIVHGLPPAGQTLPVASKVQSAAQQSPSSVLPSSHCSPMFTSPSPQAPIGAKAIPSRPGTLGAIAVTTPSGTPTVTRKLFELGPKPQLRTP